MAANWMRRIALALFAGATAMVLAACGSSSVASALTPSRFIVFGDALSDIGQNGGKRYTVNDGSVNNWTLQLASHYGKTIAPSSAGGLSYAWGNARVLATPDAAGGSAPPLSAQIDSFLATNQFTSSDLVVIDGGISDLIVAMQAVLAGSMTPDAMVAAATQTGADLGAQVRRLVNAGAKHVLLASAYDLSKTPWAAAINQKDLLYRATRALNDSLKVSIVDLGANVLYLDTEYYVNLYVNSPGSFSFSVTNTPVCTSIDPSNGLGIGTNQVNSLLCTSATLVSGADPTRYVFADPLYLTPSAHRQFGDYAYDQLTLRW